MLFFATYKILREAITKLLGEEPSKDLVEKIKGEIIKIYDNDLRIHHFHIHDYIVHKELTLHIRLNKDLTIEHGHKIASDIEKIIIEKFKIIATVHVEPLE